MWKFLLISLALIQAIQCRTNQDVIDDFEPVFAERDEEFNVLQNLTEQTMIPKFLAFEQEVSKQGELLINDWFPESKERTIENITVYIEQLGLNEYPELVQHCIDELNTTLELNKNMLYASGRTCTLVTFKKYQSVYNDYKDIMTKFDNEHKVLNVTREECIKLKTPFDVQTCVINDLYTFYIPYLKDVTEYNNQLIEGWTKKLETIKNDDLKLCFDTVQDDVDMHEKHLIDTTKICIWFVQKPNE